MPAAARRHLMAADLLVTPKGRKDVAGYLYGIAAECAVKAMMADVGLGSVSGRREDPFYQHFPDLRTSLRDKLQGRRGTPLITFINNDAFMNNWSTRMRYSDGRDIDERWIDSWAAQARQAVASIDT